MRHVVKAWEAMPMNDANNKFFIEIENSEELKGIAPIVKFAIQSDPIGEVGVNGCQAVDMLEYVKYLFQSLNEAFPCRENSLTITKVSIIYFIIFVFFLIISIGNSQGKYPINVREFFECLLWPISLIIVFIQSRKK